MYCNTLQHAATHCNTLQHAATHCNSLRHNTTHCNTLQHTAPHCNTLQITATHCNTLRCSTHRRTHRRTHRHTKIGSGKVLVLFLKYQSFFVYEPVTCVQSDPLLVGKTAHNVGGLVEDLIGSALN